MALYQGLSVMCCRVSIWPFEREIAVAVLIIGQFTAEPGASFFWKRQLSTMESVNAFTEEGKLMISIMPGVSNHLGHFDARVQASIMFEIAARYAQKVNGIIRHQSNVDLCRADGKNVHIIAEYPERPLLWENLCPGWREVFIQQTGGPSCGF